MKKNAFTLTEVLISIAFIIMVVWVATSSHLFTMEVYDRIWKQAKSASQANFILFHVTRNLLNATDVQFDETAVDHYRGLYTTLNLITPPNPPAGFVANHWILIRKDINNTPTDISDDIFCHYRWTAASGGLYPISPVLYAEYPASNLFDTSKEMSLGNVLNLWFTCYSAPPAAIGNPPGAGIVPSSSPMRNAVTVNIDVLAESIGAAGGFPGSPRNPEVILQATVTPRGMTAQE